MYKVFCLLLCAVAVVGMVAAAFGSLIDPSLTRLTFGATASIMITLSNGTAAILEPLKTQVFANREDRLNAVANALILHAELNQVGVLNLLSTFTGLEITAYWVSNQIFVRGASSLVISALQRLPSVGAIEPERFVRLHDAQVPYPPEGEAQAEAMTKQNGVNTWGVNKIQAPDVWNLGYKGQGIVVANIDTGVRRTHTALSSRYRGTYGWYDPYSRTSNPSDTQGHGTHTMGTICGSGGIGVAPNSTWMACKGCDSSTCSSNALTACGQFMQCPTLTDGSGKDCSKAPHLVSNSWGGGQGSTWYNSIVNSWRTAGIIPIFSIGNDGPNCGTANSPGDQPNLISVGATNSSDALASYSSVGPSKSNSAVKPEIAAPGSSVKSSYYSSDSSYATMSGTSMACPHVAGVVALLFSKNPNLSYDQIYSYLTNNTDRTSLLGSGQNCGGRSESQWPNNSFGYGRVNALKAIKAF